MLKLRKNPSTCRLVRATLQWLLVNSGFAAVPCLRQPSSTIFKCLRKCSTTLTPEIVFYYVCDVEREMGHGAGVVL